MATTLKVTDEMVARARSRVPGLSGHVSTAALTNFLEAYADLVGAVVEKAPTTEDDDEVTELTRSQRVFVVSSDGFSNDRNENGYGTLNEALEKLRELYDDELMEDYTIIVGERVEARASEIRLFRH